MTRRERQAVDDLCWKSLRAVEVTVEEIEDEFDGEAGPSTPDIRGALDGIRKELEDLHEQVRLYVEPVRTCTPTRKCWLG